MINSLNTIQNYWSLNFKMETVKKPWGKEEILEVNEKYVVKRLTMKKGHKCSLQYHNFKHETVYLLSGRLKIYLGENENNLTERVFNPGEYLSLPPKKIHRMEAVEDSIYLEASTPELDDVVRIIDDYSRN